MRINVFLLILGFLAPSLLADQHHPPASEATQNRIAELLASPDRPERQRVRDKYRHPQETLTFLGLKPGTTVVEVFPGGQGGFYRRILEPFITETGGRYVPLRESDDWPTASPAKVPYGEVDHVFIFRAHGFLIYEEPAGDHVMDIYDMLRPGGVMTIVDHAEREDVVQDPVSENGYVQASYFRDLAEAAGFEFVAESDVNRNPADTKVHPYGVYSLPPVLRGTAEEKEKHLAIGESDRFTHIYRKPLED